MSTINIAIIGYGFSAKIFHIPFIEHNRDLTLHTIIQRNPTATNDAAADHPGVRVFRSTEEFYADAGASAAVRVVVVTTDHASHHFYCREAVERGKDVVVEKPFTTRSEDAIELVQLGVQRGVSIFVYQSNFLPLLLPSFSVLSGDGFPDDVLRLDRRFDSDYRSLVRILESGQLGEVVSLESHFDRYRPLAQVQRQRSWNAEQVPGNGILWDLGPHLIDQSLRLFGVPQRVFGIIRDQRRASSNPVAVWGEEGFVDDFFEVALFYDGDGTARLPFIVKLEASSLSCLEKQVRFILRGTKGGWEKYGMDTQEGQLLAGMTPGDEGFGVEPEENYGTLATGDGKLEKTPAEKGNYGIFYTELVQHLRGQGHIPRGEACVIKIIELVGESNRSGRIVDVRLPPEIYSTADGLDE